MKPLHESKARTGLKFGYPDGYYRSQYPHYYSIPKSATAALDLENETRAPKEKINGPTVNKKAWKSYREYVEIRDKE